MSSLTTNLALAMAALLIPPLTSATCTTFVPTPGWEQGSWVTTNPGYFEPKPGGQVPVTKVVNCTAEAGATGDCPVDRYPMVIPLDTYARDMATEYWDYFTGDLSGAVAALRASPDLDQHALRRVNFDSVVFYNYTIPDGDFDFGYQGQLWLDPEQMCWYGTFSGCGDAGDGSAELEGRELEVCGNPYIKGTGPDTPRDQAVYSVWLHYVERDLTPEEVASQPELPYARSVDFDWSVASHLRRGPRSVRGQRSWQV